MHFSLLFIDFPSMATSMSALLLGTMWPHGPGFLRLHFKYSTQFYSCVTARVSFPPHPLALKFIIDGYISTGFFMKANLHLEFTLLMTPCPFMLHTLQDYSYKSATFINSFHTLKHSQMISKIINSPNSRCKAYLSHGPNPKLFLQQAGYHLFF